MFETEAFRQELIGRIKGVLRTRSLSDYDERIVDVLAFLASAHESHLMQLENARPLPLRRGMKEAVKSAEQLLESAAAFTKSEGRVRMSMNDFRAAYSANFCKVWPFCR